MHIHHTTLILEHLTVTGASHKAHGARGASMSTLGSMELVSLARCDLKNTGLLLEVLDLLGGELGGEPAGGVLVVVEDGVLGLLLAAEIYPRSTTN
jgi:hypothetical protein